MKLGIALSGGGIRGIAHAGVIKSLEENGIKIDDELLKICDMDGNGKITPYDAFLINIMLAFPFWCFFSP